MILAAIVLARSPDSSVGQLAVLWLSTNLPPTILLLVFLIRRVRAVGPLVVTFMVLALTGSNLLLSILDRRQALLQSVAKVGFSLGLGGTGVFWAIILIGFILFAVLGWLALQWIRRRYQAKSVNDQSLTLDALWLLFGVSYAVGLVFEGAAWMLPDSRRSRRTRPRCCSVSAQLHRPQTQRALSACFSCESSPSAKGARRSSMRSPDTGVIWATCSSSPAPTWRRQR